MVLHDPATTPLRVLRTRLLPFVGHRSGICELSGNGLAIGCIGDAPDLYEPDKWHNYTSRIEHINLWSPTAQETYETQGNILGVAKTVGVEFGSVFVLLCFLPDPNSEGSVNGRLYIHVHNGSNRSSARWDLRSIVRRHYGACGAVTGKLLFVLSVDENMSKLFVINRVRGSFIFRCLPGMGHPPLDPKLSLLSGTKFVMSCSSSGKIQAGQVTKTGTVLNPWAELLLPEIAKGASFVEIYFASQSDAGITTAAEESDIFSIFFKLRCADSIARWYLVTIPVNKFWERVLYSKLMDGEDGIPWSRWGEKAASFELVEGSERWSNGNHPIDCEGSGLAFLIPRADDSEHDLLVLRDYKEGRTLQKPRRYSNRNCFARDVLSRLDYKERREQWIRNEDWTRSTSIWLSRDQTKILVNRDTPNDHIQEVGVSRL